MVRNVLQGTAREHGQSRKGQEIAVSAAIHARRFWAKSGSAERGGDGDGDRDDNSIAAVVAKAAGQSGFHMRSEQNPGMPGQLAPHRQSAVDDWPHSRAPGRIWSP